MGIEITGGGYYVPENIIDNEALSTLVETSDEWIFSRTGIRQRRISTGEKTSELCLAAAQKILESTGITAEEIDVIVVATATPDYLSPSTACIVQGSLGARQAFAFDIGAACSGFVYALSVCEKLLRGGTYRKALVLGAETLSKMVDWTDRGTCVLFGDGAGGVLLSKGPGESFIAEDLHSDGNRYKAVSLGRIPVRNPYAPDPEEGCSYIEMDGRAIFDFAVRSVPESINAVLERGNASINDLKYIVPHQANERITNTLAKKLNADPALLYRNTCRYGNTSSASIPIALGEMFEQGLIYPGRGDKLVLTGFGGGLTWGSLLVRI